MVRIMTASDIDRVITILKAAHAESDFYAFRDYNEPMARYALEAFSAMPDGYASVVERDGEVVGFMIAMLTPLWWRLGHEASVIAAYVLPKYRGAGLALVRDFVRWAKGLGSVDRISLGVSFGGETGERSSKLFKRMGFKQTGAHHVLEV